MYMYMHAALSLSGVRHVMCKQLGLLLSIGRHNYVSYKVSHFVFYVQGMSLLCSNCVLPNLYTFANFIHTMCFYVLYNCMYVICIYTVLVVGLFA